mgnify:CR=1 FL=1
MCALTYKSAGVDIERADEFKRKIATLAKDTYMKGVVSGVGGFAALFDPAVAKMKKPILVSGTDGVGTKIKIACAMGIHDTVGIDLVAMCANDVLTTGARPLFFLDYFATARLSEQIAFQVIKGIAQGCKEALCALIGGETAQMPDVYQEGEYDLAGFCVGIVEKQKIVDGKQCKKGDVLVGLASSGLHSNGFSLVRKLIQDKKLDLHKTYSEFEAPLGEVLLTPTRIYVKPVLTLLEKVKVHAMAHITGGGIGSNLTRVLPRSLFAKVVLSKIPKNPIFDFIRRLGVEEDEMRKVFNLGVGYVLAVPAKSADEALRILKSLGENPFVLGELGEGERGITWE